MALYCYRAQPLFAVAYSGQVVGEAQGDASSIDKFMQHLKMGPSAANVTKLDHKEIETKEGDSGFER